MTSILWMDSETLRRPASFLTLRLSLITYQFIIVIDKFLISKIKKFLNLELFAQKLLKCFLHLNVKSNKLSRAGVGVGIGTGYRPNFNSCRPLV